MEENEVNDGLQLADEVVSAIAGIATKGIEGMAKMAGGFTEGIKNNYFIWSTLMFLRIFWKALYLKAVQSKKLK